MTTQTEWLTALIGSDSRQTAAAKAGIPLSTLNYQIRHNSLTAANVIAIATAYDMSVLQALVSTGFIDIDDAASMSITQALELATDKALLDEFGRRLRLLRGEDADAPLDELAARRHPSDLPKNYGDQLLDEPHAADSSPKFGGTLDDWEP